MDKNLIKEIENVLSSESMSCNFIADDQAVQLIQNVATKFGLDFNQLFMWVGKNNFEAHHYEETPDSWEPSMKGFLKKFDEPLFLTITDEQYFPWKVFKCNKESIIKILKEVRFFEYFIFDSAMDYVLFDTHDNSLILLHQT